LRTERDTPNLEGLNSCHKPTEKSRLLSFYSYLLILAHVCEDVSKILIATRSCFGHTSIDYAYQINVLFSQHKVDLIELFLSYINFHKAFFHQGYELLSIDTEKDFNSITAQVKSNDIFYIEERFSVICLVT